MATSLFSSSWARRWSLALGTLLGASVAAQAQAPANDDCAGAITLTSAATCVTTAGTTVGATQSVAPILCGGFTSPGANDVWYKFVATATSHVVQVTGGTGFDVVLDIRSGACPGVNIGCADATASGGTETSVATGLTVGSTYYARVYAYGATATGTFTICVSVPGSCAAVTNAAVVTSGGTATTATAQLTFTGPTGATSYALTLAPTAGGTTPVTGTLAGSPINLTGLTPNTSYTVTIATNCSNGGTSSIVTVVFTSGPAVAPPANDDPAGAVTLAVATTCTPTSSTNSGASTTTASGYANPGTCGIAVTPVDVWFSFTTIAAQTAATVTVTGAPAGLVRVFSAASATGPFTQVGCAAGTTNNTVAAPVSLTGLTANTRYFISVSGYGSGDNQGAFTICVTRPTGLAVRTTLAGGELTVFPNPAHQAFTLSLPALGTARTAQVELVNALGQTMSRQTINLTAGGTRATIDAASLKAGVYSVKVQASGETAITRLVIE